MQLERSHAVSRAKTKTGRRAMLAREAKILENPKSLLVLKGHRPSGIVTELLSNIHLLKKPLCKKLLRKNDILPFDAGGETHLENLCRLNDCSLFAIGNHNKKRPHNLIIGRTFGFRILDMIEFGVTEFTPISKHKRIKSAPGTAPCVIFIGDFEASDTTRNVKSLLFDIFRGPTDIKRLNLGGVDRAIVFTLVGENVVKFRHYHVSLKRAADLSLPRAKLEEVGPTFDLTLRRSQLASEIMRKEAMKKPRDPRIDWRTKNVDRDQIGDKKGHIHVGRQDLNGLSLARMKGLNKKRGSDEMDVENSGAHRQQEERSIVAAESPPKKLKTDEN